MRDSGYIKRGQNQVKGIFSGFLVAFSMYSTIPVPQIKWEKQTMRWAMCFLPLVGVIIGLAEWGWLALCLTLGASELFYSAIATLIPVIVSGGIHLDGLCDTCDALCSFGDKDKKLAILKDPHIGAFGPMWLMAFLLAETACFAQMYEALELSPVVFAGFALSRTLGGSKIVLMPCAKDSGLAYIFAENSDRKAVAAVLASEAAVIIMMLCALPGIKAAGGYTALMVLWYYMHDQLCRKSFGGITGDLAGFFISIGELLALTCAAFGGLVL